MSLRRPHYCFPLVSRLPYENLRLAIQKDTKLIWQLFALELVSIYWVKLITIMVSWRNTGTIDTTIDATSNGSTIEEIPTREIYRSVELIRLIRRCVNILLMFRNRARQQSGCVMSPLRQSRHRYLAPVVCVRVYMCMHLALFCTYTPCPQHVIV